MPRLIGKPAVLRAAGSPPKQIEEYVGRVASGHAQVSVARMLSPQGWSEPPQQPEFLEITLVLKGRLRVSHDAGSLEVGERQAVVTQPGETVRYETPYPGGAEYVAICLPAFGPDLVHRKQAE